MSIGTTSVTIRQPTSITSSLNLTAPLNATNSSATGPTHLGELYAANLVNGNSTHFQVGQASTVADHVNLQYRHAATNATKRATLKMNASEFSMFGDSTVASTLNTPLTVASITATANLGVQLNNTVANRKIVLYEVGAGDHQYYGFGVNEGILRYQIPTTSDNHIFYAGTSTTTSRETFKITGDGGGFTSTVYASNGLAKITLTSGGGLEFSSASLYNTGLYVPAGAGDFSTSAIPGDLIVRNITRAIHIQSGAGASAITIDTSNNVTIRNRLLGTTNITNYNMSANFGWPTNSDTAPGNWAVGQTIGNTLTNTINGTFRNDLGYKVWVNIIWVVRRDSSTLGINEIYIREDVNSFAWGRATTTGVDWMTTTATFALNTANSFTIVGFQSSGVGANFLGGASGSKLSIQIYYN